MIGDRGTSGSSRAWPWQIMSHCRACDCRECRCHVKSLLSFADSDRRLSRSVRNHDDSEFFDLQGFQVDPSRFSFFYYLVDKFFRETVNELKSYHSSSTAVCVHIVIGIIDSRKEMDLCNKPSTAAASAWMFACHSARCRRPAAQPRLSRMGGKRCSIPCGAYTNEQPDWFALHGLSARCSVHHRMSSRM